MISVGDKFTGTADATIFFLLPSFIIEENANFQLEVSKINVIFFPFKFIGPLNFFQRPSLRLSVTLRILRINLFEL